MPDEKIEAGFQELYFMYQAEKLMDQIDHSPAKLDESCFMKMIDTGLAEGSEYKRLPIVIYKIFN